MPGFKLIPVVDRFEALTCAFCRLILREAVQTEDGDRLCKSCYEYIRENPAETHGLSLGPREQCHPDVAVRKEIDKLIVRCANYREDGEGCSWEGTLKAHETEHKSLCPAPCTNNGCTSLIPATLLSKHVNQDCGFREVVCPNCNEKLQYRYNQTHLEKQCGGRMVVCSECLDNIRSNNLHRHKLLDCTACRQCIHCRALIKVGNAAVHLAEPEARFDHIQTLAETSKSTKETIQKKLVSFAAIEGGVRNWQDTWRSFDSSCQVLIQSLTEQVQSLESSRRTQSSVGDALTQLSQQIDHHDQMIREQKGYVSGTGLTGGEGGDAVLSDKTVQLMNKAEEIERQVAMVKVHLVDLEKQLRVALSASFNGSYLWSVTDVHKRRQEAIEYIPRDGRPKSVYSPAFYTGRNGYKMVIQAFLNGEGSGYGSHLSVYLILLKGEHDPLLKWPFDYRVALILVDQMSGEHIIQNFKPPSSANPDLMPTNDRNICNGCPKFAPNSVLDEERFVNSEGVMYIKCIVDTSQIIHP